MKSINDFWNKFKKVSKKKVIEEIYVLNDETFKITFKLNKNQHKIFTEQKLLKGWLEFSSENRISDLIEFKLETN